MASKRITPLAGWAPWLLANPIAARHVRGTRRDEPAGYFLRVHALTENILRRTLLVGLRKKNVLYSEAIAWLHDNDTTPDRVRYPQTFDTLLGGNPSFTQITAPGLVFGELWILWLEFTKTVRNHLSHGVRPYSFDWLEQSSQIDQAFLMEYCNSVRPLVGGSLGDDLRKLTPRLGSGIRGVNIAKLMNRKAGKPRPTISLQAAEARFRALGIA